MADQLLRSGFRFYQSANADAESIKEGFIIRQHEYEIIMEDIRRNKMEGSIQHYLLLGRRGSGKSTLLKRIQVEIDTDEELQKTYIAINPAEEQANIYRLSDFWNEILQELEYANVEVSVPDWDDDIQSYSQKLAAAVHEAIHRSGKKVILLLDNIDRIFENLKDDASMLREYLLNFDDLKIIGGSTRMTEHFWKYDLPFYQFFRIIRLEPLSSDEVKKLLLYWADKLDEDDLRKFVEKQSGQLETIRILTDGLPRTLQFFVNILLTHGPETGYEYLRLIMDQVTPLYQERLNTLPPSQRKIVLKMAFLWETVGTKEIAEASHMDNKVISAQMKQLVDKGIVDKIETNNKNHLYRLSERFFNLWLIFTQGSPNEKRKARCLTIFLENFYSPEELRGLVTDHLKRLQSAEWHPNKLALFTKAIAQSKYISSDERDELIERTVALKNIDHDLKRQLPLQTDEINKKIVALTKKQDWPLALRMANDIEQDDDAKWFLLGHIYQEKQDYNSAEKYYLMAVKTKTNTSAMNNLAILYEDQKKSAEAEKYYLMAIEIDNDPDIIYNLALLYRKEKKLADAEKYYLMAIETGNDSVAMTNLGVLYEDQNKLAEAEKYYLMAIERDNNSTAMANLGVFYENQNKLVEAEKYYLMAIERNNDSKAMSNLGLLYNNQNRLAEAEKYYLMAIERNNYSTAMFNLGLFYEDQNKQIQAEKYYLMAIERDNNSTAMTNLGLLYQGQNKEAEAEKYYLMAIENNDDLAMSNLSILYYSINKNKTRAKELVDKSLSLRVDYKVFILKIVIDLWNGEVKGACSELKKFVTENLLTPNADKFIPLTFRQFLVHHQTNFILSLFSDHQFGNVLKDSYQPIYYAAAMLSGKDKNIALKIPPEINETVNKIMAEIKDLQKFYYGKS